VKKLASALLAFLMLAQPVADVASAKVLIVEQRAEDDDNGAAEGAALRDIRELPATILRMYGLRQGVDYDIVNGGMRGVNATNLRDGNVVLRAGYADAVLKHYDAVILTCKGSAGVSSGMVRTDSLFKWQNTSRFNSVPMLFLELNGVGMAPSDSSGFGGDVTAMGTMGQVMYSTKHPSWRFRTGVNKVAGAYVNPGGTRRVLIGASVGRSEGTQQDVGAVGYTALPCQWCDSVWTSTPGTGDSAITWVRYMDHIPGAKPTIYCQSNDYASVSVNIPAIWAGMAFLDSLTRGGVFGSAEPPSFGIMVPGVGSRGLATGWPWSTCGIPPDDTTNAYRTVDSLATLGVPIAFGAPANIDSITTYGRDIQRVMSASAQFSLFPFSRYGIDTTAAAIGAGRTATTKYQPLDIFGAWRNRTAIGDDSFAGKDSSLSSHVRFAFARHDSLYPGRVDHALYAPIDDWSPKNFCCIGQDSVFSAFARAGARAVVSNWRVQRAQVGKLQTQQQGAAWEARRVRAPYAFGGTNVNLLASAVVDSGAARFDNGTGQVGLHGGFETFKQIDRFWLSFIGMKSNHSYGYAGDAFNTDSLWSRQRVLVVPFASLGSGSRADRSTLPTRPGWWYTKAIVNAVKVINDFGVAGRTYVTIKKVEDVQP